MGTGSPYDGMVKSLSTKPDRPVSVLTIAGFDPSSGAGVTADLQVFAAHGLFGTAAITALTVQSTLGVTAVEAVRADLLAATLTDLVRDIPPAGIKIGMLGNRENVLAIAKFLRSLSDTSNGGNDIPIVLDPVLASSSGACLLEEDAIEALKMELLPLVSWITPNLDELRHLGSGGDTAAEMMTALGNRFPELQIVATGGDSPGPPVDLWRVPGGRITELCGRRVETSSTHGTGCAFSSALLSRLALGQCPREALAGAKQYVESALEQAPGIGHGKGPLNLLWPLRGC